MNIWLVIAAVLAAFAVASGMLYKENQSLRESIVRLEVTIRLKDDVIKGQNRAIDISQSTMERWGNENNEIKRNSDVLIAELAGLRAIENQRSLSAPFAAGGDADARRRAILVRFAGHGESDRAASQDPSSDTAGTIGAEPSGTAP